MPTSTMTGLEKVAVLLKRMPTDVVEKVMRHLDPGQAGQVLSQLKKLNEQGDMEQRLPLVLDEAMQILHGPHAKQERPGAGKAHETKAAASSVPRETGVDIRVGGQPEDKPAPSAAALLQAEKDAAADPMRALAALPPELLATALNNENARTASLLMNSLDIEVASQIYKRLTPAKRREISMRFTDQTTVGEELVKRIAQALFKKCQTLSVAATPTAGPVEGAREKRIAALLRELERTERMELLTALTESDADLTGRVKSLLYEFEDILRMENSSVQKLLSEVDVKTLGSALRGAAPELEEKILTNLSKRAQESLKEEISLTGTVPAPKVRQARQMFLEAMQRLDQRGELVMIEATEQPR